MLRLSKNSGLNLFNAALSSILYDLYNNMILYKLSYQNDESDYLPVSSKTIHIWLFWSATSMVKVKESKI